MGKDTAAEKATPLFPDEPLVDAVLLRYYVYIDSENVQPFLSNLKCKITAPLAASILEAGNSTNQTETELGFDS